MGQEAGDQHRADGTAFDLVLATRGRTTEVDCFLGSLSRQTYKRFRVILVDQNGDNRLDQIVARHRGAFAIAGTASQPGLSRARNVALQLLVGDVVAFPDDDCMYPPDLLGRVGELLRRHPEWDGVAGRTRDSAGESSFLRWLNEPTLVTRRNVWRTVAATTIFLRSAVIERVGHFDESLGAGSGTQWGSGEETDYALRAIAAGLTIAYEPSLWVVHEAPQPELATGLSQKAYLTGMGNSRVLRKHGYPVWTAASRVLQLVGGCLYLLARGRVSLARFYAAMALGRIRGWQRG